MTIAQSKVSDANNYKGTDVFNDVLECNEVDDEGTNKSDQVSYTDGSMLVEYDGEWVAEMWDNSGDELDSDIYI